MDLLSRTEYLSGRTKTICPHSFHYVPRAELPLGMTARQFFDSTQEGPLDGILPEQVDSGEVIEIDDGLQPYYFYVLDHATVIPLTYFRPSSN
ncbi:MAG: hypothetical protein HFF64_10145 [Oscillospiraceae bacterium]|nr:hypothetical protein [Oscillospiraceae bacterium]